MNLKTKLTLFCLLWLPLFAFSQTSVLKGVVTDENNKSIEGATVTIPEKNLQAITDASGLFSIANVPYGNYAVEITAENFATISKQVVINSAQTDLGVLSAQHEEVRGNQDNIPVVSLSESEVEETSSESVASVLGASRDPFTSATSFVFSIAHFRIRGYEDGNFVTMMNGVPMTDLVSDRTLYYTWGGLNDVTRNRETTLGLSPAYYSYGGLGGTYNLDTRASRQRKQIQASYSLSNRSYDSRFMLTYGSGILKNGWSFSASLSRRWANDGYVKGTYYDGFSYFGSVEKFINDQHSLSLTVFGAPTKNGRSAPAVQEMYDIAGTNYYNPNWGYQNGKVRNAVNGNTHVPTGILTHEFKIDNTSSLLTAFSYASGTSKVSRLDWYNATDPRPDYYRNLPSYLLGADDSTGAVAALALLTSSEDARQIDWDGLYETNLHNDTFVVNANGIAGDTVRGKRSLYILQDRVTANKIFNFNSTYNKTIGDNTTLSAGISYEKQNAEYYTEVNDLLGGDFYVDLNQYANRDFPNDTNAIQNDLNHPNRILNVGDKYGYDYVAHFDKISGWWQTIFKFDHLDFFFGSQVSQSKFFREGKTRYGLFPNDSYGDAPTQTFMNFGAKGGITYKINGRNYMFVNAALQTNAPDFANAYVSPRTRNTVSSDLRSEEVSSIEGGYLLKAPRIKGKAILYYTQVNNSIKTTSYFDDTYLTFVNFTMPDVDKRYTGTELSAEASLGQGFSANAVAALGQYFYTNRPVATITRDNNAAELDNQIIYQKDFHISGSPEKAYTAGLSYRGKKFWYVNLNVNYFDGIWIDFYRGRRTVKGIDLVDPSSELFSQIVDQEKVKGQFTMDISGGKSWKLNGKIKGLTRNTFLLLNVGLTNITNNKKFITNGYEYSRFDYTDKNVSKFASKYFYAYGTTFFINLTLRMN